MILLQIAGLLVYEVGYALAALAAILLVINVLLHLVEHRTDRIKVPRMVSLLVYVTVLGVFFSPVVDLSFNPGLPALLQSIGQYSLFLAAALNADWHRANIILLGLLLVSNEANILIRYQFSILKLEPKPEAKADNRIITIVDERGYNAGRVIGILERVLVYYFVLNAQFAAIGLILAAKSFTRFKDLEKREYAEYVLIGTLSSTLLAMLVAGAIQSLLP
jgi:hypothetical protein